MIQSARHMVVFERVAARSSQASLARVGSSSIGGIDLLLLASLGIGAYLIYQGHLVLGAAVALVGPVAYIGGAFLTGKT